jgi:hypothetical protein
MVGIGLRVYSNSEIFYSVIAKKPDGTFEYQAMSSLVIPKSLEKPEQLNYTRNTLLDIFHEYNVARAGIRVAEYTAQVATDLNIERYYIEGIIQESVASSSIERYIVGQISVLTTVLNIPREDFKKYADGNTTFPDLPAAVNWSTLGLEQRESIIVCHCALNL